MFKVGDKVRCIYNESWEDVLDVGKVYTVEGFEAPDWVRLKDLPRPNGNGLWCSSRFELYDFAPQASVKDTNPKDACGTAKVPMLSVFPLRVLGDVAVALFEGARKYGRHNYRPAGVRASVYMDAVGRHLAAWYEGEDLDPDSGVSHVSKAIAALVVLRDSMMQGNWTDDRPPKVDSGWVQEMNEEVKAIIERYPNAVPAFTEVSK